MAYNLETVRVEEVLSPVNSGFSSMTLDWNSHFKECGGPCDGEGEVDEGG